MKDRGIVLLTHGTLGEAVMASAELIIGPVENVRIYSLLKEDNLDIYFKRIESDLRQAKERHSIFISDLKGGSTAHAATYMAHVFDGVAISGLNIAVFASAVNRRAEEDAEKLIHGITEDGRQGISDIRLM